MNNEQLLMKINDLEFEIDQLKDIIRKLQGYFYCLIIYNPPSAFKRLRLLKTETMYVSGSSIYHYVLVRHKIKDVEKEK